MKGVHSCCCNLTSAKMWPNSHRQEKVWVTICFAFWGWNDIWDVRSWSYQKGKNELTSPITLTSFPENVCHCVIIYSFKNKDTFKLQADFSNTCKWWVQQWMSHPRMKRRAKCHRMVNYQISSIKGIIHMTHCCKFVWSEKKKVKEKHSRRRRVPVMEGS